MKRFISFTLLLVGLVVVAATSALAENRALIIGIGDGYDGQNKLRGPETDARLAQEIARKIGIPAENTKVFINKQANRTNILAGFKWLQEGAQNGGKAFIYYSGHGFQIEDKNGDPDDDGCDEVIVPVDLKFVTDKEIKQLLMGLGSADVILMADSCFSGTIHKSLYGGRNKAAKVLKAKGSAPTCGAAANQKGFKRHKSLGVDSDTVSGSGKLIVLSATNKHEVAYASFDGKGGSLFTQSVYDIIQEKGIKTSFREVIAEAQEQVKRQSEQHNAIKHTPQLDGNPEYFDWSFDLTGKAGGVSERPASVEATNSNSEMIEWLVNNSKFAVSVVADRKQLRMGEKIGFEVFSSQDGYINIVEHDPDGMMTVLYPNQYKSNNVIKANTKLRVPEDIGGFKITGQGTPGDSRIVALVTSEQFNMYTLGDGKLHKFKVFPRKDFGAINKIVSKGIGGTRSLGVQKDESSNQDFGANAITIKVSR